MGGSVVFFTEKQLRILEFIQRFQDERGVSPTLEEMATHFGVTKITIYEHLNQLEKKGAITRTKYRARSIEIVVPPPSRRKRFAVPLQGSIRAGAPLESVATEDVLNLDEVLRLDGDCFALRVQGNSMDGDQIRNGDYVMVERRTTAENGDTVVAVLENGEATLKRYYRERGRIRLQPANSDMKPIFARKVEIRGVVVGLVRRFS